MAIKVGVFGGHDDDTWENTGGKGIRTNLEKDGVYEEYDSNIVIARETANRLRQYNEIEVYFPQENGRDMTLSERVRYCNDHNLDTVVFIHSNAAGRSATGACAFYWYNSNDGKRFAEIYRDELIKKDYPLYSNGTYPCQESGWSSFYVVKNTKMPVILTENFFFTNPNELKKYLLNPNELSKLAEVHERSVVRYLGIKPSGNIKPSKPNKPSKPKPKPSKPKAKGIIAQIQDTLNKRYNTKIAEDNIYGKNTKKALIKGYQTELNKQFGANLVVDGIWGRKTRSATRTVSRGARGNITWIIQATLICLGYNLSLDSIYGSGTKRTIEKFQDDSKIVSDGVFGKNTAGKMFD